MNEMPYIKLLSRNDLGQVLGMSKRSTYRLSDLPAAVVLGNGDNAKKMWKMQDIEQWLDSKKETH